MPEQTNHNPKHLDDNLADFVDDLMSGKSPQELGLSEVQELRELQETALIFFRTVRASMPTEATAKKIRQRLTSAQSESSPEPQDKSFLDRLREQFFRDGSTWQSAERRRRTLVFRLAIAIVLVFIFLTPILTSQDTVLPGATGGAGLLPYVILVLAGAAVVVWWLSRRGQ